MCEGVARPTACIDAFHDAHGGVEEVGQLVYEGLIIISASGIGGMLEDRVMREDQSSKIAIRNGQTRIDAFDRDVFFALNPRTVIALVDPGVGMMISCVC